MSRILLSAYIDAAKSGEQGIYRKMDDLADGFRALGLDANLVCLHQKNLWVNGKSSATEFSPMVTRRSFYKALSEQLDVICPDIWYLRYPFSTPGLVRLLKKVKQKHPKIKVVMEWPTYPYDLEFTGINRWKRWVDSHYQKKVLPMLDAAVVLGNPHQFNNIPTLHLTNGYNCHTINIVGNKQKSPRIWVAVGHWQYWHGLDRLIEGLAQYFKQPEAEDILLKVIGKGQALEGYKQQTYKAGLNDKIEFLGSIDEFTQKKVLKESQLGIGVLASFRKELIQHAPLKHRMYACFGLPFIYSTTDVDFEGQPFVLKLPEREEAIDIQTILSWLDEQTTAGHQIAEFARNNLDWTEKCRKILEMLNVSVRL